MNCNVYFGGRVGWDIRLIELGISVLVWGSVLAFFTVPLWKPFLLNG